MPYRCPRCGGLRNGRNASSGSCPARAAAEASAPCEERSPAPLTPPQRCSMPTTLTEELFAGTCRRTETTWVLCCDRECGCREFDAASRDTFWPSFSRPRWLRCDELYSSSCRRPGFTRP